MLSAFAKSLIAKQLPAPHNWPEHYDAILITGPTASGKSALSMALAELWPASIISVDSALVYKGLDIGSAKPSAAEQAQQPHYLLDLIEPTQSYSVAQFLNDVQQAMVQSKALRRLPLLVGGTMMYVNAMRQGISTLPPSQLDSRTAIEAQARELGWTAMHVQLSKIDPIAALRIAPLDTQRVTRALEIFHTTGRSLSDWHLNAPKPTPLMAQGRWLHISIEHEGEAGKLLLWQRIENRFDTMLEQGFLDEVRRLRSNPDLHADLASIRCVGYRQAWGHLTGDYDLNQMRALGITATRQLAKRQMTWLRSMPERVVFNPFQT